MDLKNSRQNRIYGIDSDDRGDPDHMVGDKHDHDGHECHGDHDHSSHGRHWPSASSNRSQFEAHGEEEEEKQVEEKLILDARLAALGGSFLQMVCLLKNKYLL